MEELEEDTQREEGQCPAKTRAAMLQRRFQELITNIIQDTQETFSSLMEDLDDGKNPVKKLPSLLPQTTDRFHCRMVPTSWKLPKPGYGIGSANANPGKKFVACLDGPLMRLSNIGGCCSENSSSSLDAASTNVDKDEYEASERLKRLIEEELRCRRKEVITDRNFVLYPTKKSSYDRDLRENSHPYNSQEQLTKTASDSKTFENEYHPSSSQRLDSLIKDELRRMKISMTAVAKDELNRMKSDAQT